MSEKFTVTTIGIIYNLEGKFLITKRSNLEPNKPGIYSYPGGKVEYENDELDVLEENLKKELKEETNVEVEITDYLSSHSFKKENGDKVIVIAFIAKYLSGDITEAKSSEISEVKWIEIGELSNLNTLEKIQKVYHQAYLKLTTEIQAIKHLSVAGLVLNDKGEFLIIKNAGENTYTFPAGPVSLNVSSHWEILESNLRLNILNNIGIEIADGPIPFTDELLVKQGNFENIIQFYICKVYKGTIKIADNSGIENAKWKQFSDFDIKDFEELDYQVFEKAQKFLNNLS